MVSSLLRCTALSLPFAAHPNLARPRPTHVQAYRAARSPAANSRAKPKKQQLTDEQAQEIREAFDLFDTDGSGECPPLGTPLEPRVHARRPGSCDLLLEAAGASRLRLARSCSLFLGNF